MYFYLELIKNKEISLNTRNRNYCFQFYSFNMRIDENDGYYNVGINMMDN